MKFARTLGALAVATALSTGAYAADMPDAAMQYASPAFAWDGFYAGLGVAGDAFNGGVNAGQIEAEIGVNYTVDQFLFGVEAFGGWAFMNNSTNSALLGAEARIGYLVAPEALLYLSGGAVHYFNGSTSYATIGGGAEFAVSSDVSIDLEYKYLYNSAAVYAHEIGASALWHF